jgi:hypothetical protein
VIGPVKFAFVVTFVAVVAKVAVAAFPPILRFATGVVEATVNGAVPVATVEISSGADKLPVVVKLVPVATPIFGVTNVGEVFITKVVPVPVWDAIEVALPTEVIGPVKFAFVVTFVAVVAVVAKVAVAAFPPMLRFATGVVDDTVKGAVPVATFDTITGAVKLPVVVRLDPVAAPIFGVTSVGEVSITKVLPVPVWDAILVALPTEVIGPVKFALVVTVVAVAAFPPILRLATGVEEATVNGAVPVAIFEISCCAVKLPVKIRLVPLAAPIVGLTSTGEVKLPVVTVGLLIVLLSSTSVPARVASVPPFGGNITVPAAVAEASITV